MLDPNSFYEKQLSIVFPAFKIQINTPNVDEIIHKIVGALGESRK
jgi:hypothetical protein